MDKLSEKIISTVKEYRILYDFEHSDYKNLKLKDEVWDIVGGKLNMATSILKLKWKNLRGSYTKHLKSLNPATTQTTRITSRYRTWPWAKKMQFLRPFLKIYPSKLEKPATEDQSLELSDNHKEIVDITNVPAELVDCEMLEAPLQISARKKRKRKENCKTTTSDVDKIISYLQNQPDPYDDMDLLFLGLAKTLKKLSPKRQAATKLRIANIVLEQEVAQRKEEENLYDGIHTASVSATDL